MLDLAPLVNRRIPFSYRGAHLMFDLSHGLFSSFDVDAGTRLLLKEIAHDEAILASRRTLDAGCGTGVLGISLAASCPDMEVVMRDRDLLAVAFSSHNCWLNGIPASCQDLRGFKEDISEGKPPSEGLSPTRRAPVTVAPGLLGESDELGPYDLVISNLPAKAGQSVLQQFFLACSKNLLAPNGKAAFVIVKTLAGAADRWCQNAGLAVLRKAESKGHVVVILGRDPSLPGDGPRIAAPGGGKGLLSPYLRTRKLRTLGLRSVDASGVWGMPEFDTNSYATDLTLESAERLCRGALVREILVHEPGIGLSALWAGAVLGPNRIDLISRDVLSLKTSQANIASAFPGVSCRLFSPFEMSDLEGASVDFAIWQPDEVPAYDYISPAWANLRRIVKYSGAIVVASSSTVVTRFAQALPEGIKVLDIKRRKGFAVLEARRES